MRNCNSFEARWRHGSNAGRLTRDILKSFLTYDAPPMPSSTAVETFAIPLNGCTIKGSLHLPERDAASRAIPAVLLCRGILVPGGDARGLFDELIEALSAAGIAVAVFDHRCADLILEDFDAHTAQHDVEDARAVLGWLSSHAEVDRSCVGVLGYGLGGIAATGLAAADQIARLCLLAATTAANLAGPMIKSNGSPAAINPDHLPEQFLRSLEGIDSPAAATRLARPTLIIHGAADRFVSPEVSYEYLAAFQAARRPDDATASHVEHVLVARGNNTFDHSHARAVCIELVVDFFREMKIAPDGPMIAAE
jgi:dienelactone hydrolase